MSISALASRFIHDESRWPLVRVVFPKVPSDLAALDEHFRHIDGVLARRTPFVLIIDQREAGALDAAARDRIRQFRTSRFALLQRYRRATAFLTGTSLQKATMNAIVAVAPGSSPEQMFDSLEEAERWGLACLGASATTTGL